MIIGLTAEISWPGCELSHAQAGTLAHRSIIARDYGIPAVMAVTNAMLRSDFFNMCCQNALSKCVTMATMMHSTEHIAK